MVSHKIRLILIVVALGLSLVALVVLAIFADLSEMPEIVVGLLTALGILVPALLDAGAEQRKRVRGSQPPGQEP